MKQQDKDLLLKDLCGRLRYNVQILADTDKTFEGGLIGTLKVINLNRDWIEFQGVLTPFKFDKIKPYLRPMSSMTEEEMKEYNKAVFKAKICKDDFATNIDWLNEHHFDFRNLIEKSLALEAPEWMYK